MKLTLALFTAATVQLVSAGALPTSIMPTTTNFGTSQSGGPAYTQSPEAWIKENPTKLNYVNEANWSGIEPSSKPGKENPSPYIDAAECWNHTHMEHLNELEKRKGGGGAGGGGGGGGGGGSGGGGRRYRNRTSSANMLYNPYTGLRHIKDYATNLYNQNGWIRK
ncbi:hypothetical protein H4R33_005674 [Dimargaris cristalligena]|uniref:Uncharacterized protein n=1 Tax=Dimargaris cristalligena TaxID=215637 RepID=A0A4P9ZJ81_9FUNG|nr:hypothetical protein H4R33_005674 [Dimargaris cristalligena]RKP33264.1 hypothetical protein BJ085DRAFT_37559 [Dimargaris cristalligena]|eukprot:RKP33264.1 hypothetical protein BJ085DRAFT_37559 [Dimargaris cristalligena]